MIDKKMLSAHADAIEIARAIGMELKRKGKTMYCTCPSHKKVLGREDNNIGNCVIDARGYHCFACNSSGNVFDMVMDFRECSFSEAVKIVDGLTDGNFTLDESKNTKMQPFTAKDLELIGLSSLANPKGDAGKEVIGVSESRPLSGTFFRRGSEYVTYIAVPRITLNQLFVEDETLYYQLIADNAKQYIEKYTQTLQAFTNRGSDEFAVVFDLLAENDMLDVEKTTEIKNALLLNIKNANKILKEAQAHL